MSGPLEDASKAGTLVTDSALRRDRSVQIYLWLARPLSTRSCFVGWLVSTILFIAATAVLGGPVQGDAAVSVYSTWAIAHGHFACAYSPRGTYDFPPFVRPYAMIAPLYPLISGGLLGLMHATNTVPFPTTAQLGRNCSTALVAIYHWSFRSDLIVNTIRCGYLVWLPLLGGAILLLRAGGRGRSRWEPATLCSLALLPPVLECLLTYFHPQDLLALGLVLGSLGMVVKSKWVWAGIFMGLAFTSNQFVILAAVPLLVVAPTRERIRFALTTIASAAAIIGPISVLTSGRVLRWSLLGSGFSPPQSGTGVTLLRELRLSQNTELLVSRTLPIVCALVIAIWAKRRLGKSVLRATPLLSLVATAFAMRLVFEVSLWGYYFAACAVLIVVNDVIIGRVRGHVIAWLALFALVYDPIPWGFASNGQSWGLGVREALPSWFAVGALVLILFDAVRRTVRWYIVAWLVLVCLTLVNDPFAHGQLRTSMPNWFWQVVLVPLTIFLAVSPLFAEARTVGKVLTSSAGDVVR